MTGYAIEGRGLVKRFADRVVVDHVDIGAKPGEIVTLIGPNGAGKTLLLKMLLGLVAPDSGTIARSPGLRVGYMPQKLAVDPNLPISVARFVGLAGKGDVAASLETAGVADMAGAPMAGLSGGEMQRVLLARALMRDPQLLVLDEPAQGVDVTGQDALYALVGRLRDQTNCAVLLVSHDLHLVMARSDRVVCLNTHVCCTGQPETVGRDPAFAALFGARAGESLALYRHHHDHVHDTHGHVHHAHEHAHPHSHDGHRHG
ncbi:MAG: ATP-binding cassette domain-containing protein [Alphaproteobacteria bacterium]|nr:ATP-binding cassette domain-containing protein [Alphaproteobacteria bacterium]